MNGRSRSRTFDRKLDAERFVAGTTTDIVRGDLAAMLAGRGERDRALSAPLFLAVKGRGRLEVPMLRDHVVRPALVAAAFPETFRTDDLRHTHLL